MRILNEIGLVEDRGSGIDAMLNSLREAHLEPPRFHDTRTYFTVTFSNQSLLDPETIAWLNRYASLPLNPRQRTALAYLYRHKQITNPDYCRLNNVDSLVATKELHGLVDADVMIMHGTRRWAHYTLIEEKIVAAHRTSSVEFGQLNSRQQAGLELARRQGSLTVSEYLLVCGEKVSDRTARKDLKDMMAKGFLKQVGEARSTRYVLVDSG
jgi:predicted HTH transcriptional regulator